MQTATLQGLVRETIHARIPGCVDSILDRSRESTRPYSRRHVLRALDEVFGAESITTLAFVHTADGDPLRQLILPALESHLNTRRAGRLLVIQYCDVDGLSVLVANDRRGERWWVPLNDSANPITVALSRLSGLVGKNISIIPHGQAHQLLSGVTPPQGVTIVDWAHLPFPYEPLASTTTPSTSAAHGHLDALEAESIRIIREAVAVSKNLAMLFSMGKDSMVMLTLAQKAFWPGPVPFPLVMIDTRWKFQDMYRFRQWIETRPDLDVMVHVNPDAIRDDINPFDHGSAHHTDVTKTRALKQILETHRFDFVFGGARRDEEKSRAKERVFSVRSSNHGWNPKSQRPELWNLYNTRLAEGQSMRVFPISNWTELDVWRYVERENIPVVPLYFSKVRPFVERNGSLIMVDDDRFRLEPDEKIRFEPIRFRTLGCYPLTGGVRSEASSVADIISELEHSRVSERSSRVIDSDPGASMEQKKKEGYF